jgi:glycosyltransferase involved in cell wall biosynthesis
MVYDPPVGVGHPQTRRPVRALLVVPKYPYPVVGGLEKQAHELAKALVARGNSIHALSTKFESSQPHDALVDGVHVRRIDWIEFKPLRFLLSPIALARELRALKGQVDVVHIHNISWFGSFVSVCARRFGFPVIVKLPSIGNIQRLRGRLGGRLLIGVLRRSNAIVAMTEQSQHEIRQLGYPEANILRVPNGIAVGEDTLAQRQHRSVATAVYVGRLLPEKGLSDLLMAWTSLSALTTRAIRLRLVGAGPMQAQLKAMIHELGLTDVVEVINHVEDISSELAKADIFVLPSHAEGNSNAVLEAMRAGLPIVATAVGGTPMQVGPDGADFLVPPRAPEAIANGIRRLAADAKLREVLGRKMRERVRSLFNVERIASIYEDAYRLLAAGDDASIGSLNEGFLQENRTGR